MALQAAERELECPVTKQIICSQAENSLGHTSDHECLANSCCVAKQPQLLKHQDGDYSEQNSPHWWCMPIVSALRKQQQEDHKYKASLGYKTTFPDAGSQSVPLQ
jgi:hypothetical protein